MNDETKIIGSVFLIILLCIGLNVLDTALGYYLLPWHVFHEQVKSANKIVDKTYDADNAIYNYHWFKQKEQDIIVAEKNIDNTKMQMEEFEKLNGNKSTWDYQTKQTYMQMQTTLLGQKNYYNQQVGDYNARSAQADRAIFKDGLPLHVEQKVWI